MNNRLMIRVLCFSLIYLMLAFCAGCICAEVGSNESESTEGTNVSLVIYDGSRVTYSIIRPENGEEGVISAASTVWRRLYDINASLSVTVESDWTRNGESVVNDNYEILIGLTNRPESTEATDALPGYLDCSVSVIGNKICICGNTPERVGDAAEVFISHLNTSEDGKITYIAPQTVVGFAAYPLEKLTIGGESLMDCRIVTSAHPSAAEAGFAESLALYLAMQTGKYPPVITDVGNAPQGFEISVGITDRTDAAEAVNNGCMVVLSGRTLSVVSDNSTGYTEALSLLKAKLSSSTGAIDDFSDIIDVTGIDGARVMFVGNSFTYYGDCVHNNMDGDKKPTDSNSYFEKVAAAYGDKIHLTNFTFGNAKLSDGESNITSAYSGDGLLERMLAFHPNYYNNPYGAEIDTFYNQDYVILQQSGSNQSGTYDHAKKIAALFPPETEFLFYVTTYDVKKNLTYNMAAAKKLRDNDGYSLIPVGYMVYDLWTNGIDGSKIKYNQNCFIVDRTSSDGYHPNYLTGYITALTSYCILTGKSAVGCDWSFVSRDKIYYTNGSSDFEKILASDYDMNQIQKMIDKYIAEYNN